jgi:hypothetical protein
LDVENIVVTVTLVAFYAVFVIAMSCAIMALFRPAIDRWLDQYEEEHDWWGEM